MKQRRGRKVAWGTVTEGWDQFSEDFTFRPDFMPGPTGWKMPKCERFWLYHLIYGLSAGFPLCCVLHWTKNAAGFETFLGRSPADRRRRREIALHLRDGLNELGQHFAVCPRETHDESYLRFSIDEFDADQKYVELEEPCDQCCPEDDQLRGEGPNETDTTQPVPNVDPESRGRGVRKERAPRNADDSESQLRDL